MSHTFTKKGLKGFTLIELLVVIAIIGILSTVIAAPVQNARKKAKDVKKISELRAIGSALAQYAEANGEYPADVSALSPQYMTILPSFASTSVAARDRFAYVVYQGTPANGSPTRFAYHLGVHLDVYSDTLKNDRDCTGASFSSQAIVAPACTFFNGPASTGTGISYPGWSIGMIGSSTTSDFDGGEGTDTTCAGTAQCVFDLTETF